MTRPPSRGEGERWPFLPHILFEMATAFDLETALAFARRYGGTRLHVPTRAKAGHPISGCRPCGGS